MIRLVKDLFSPKNEDSFKRDYFFPFQNEKKRYNDYLKNKISMSFQNHVTLKHLFLDIK